MTLPFVIAHRGASGYLPEHTLAGKALAYGLGADYLEQDVVATRDSKLVVLHDLYLDDVSDVAQKFAGRHRKDGRHYVIDFDLAELRTLTLCERRVPGGAAAKYPSRFPVGTGLFGIATLEDELRLIHGLNRSMGRTVGIYPEIKEPKWHREQGADLASLLLAELQSFGYSREQDPVFVQCFDAAEIVRVKRELGSQLKLIQLVGPETEYADLLTPKGLRRLASDAYALAPHYTQLIEQDGSRRPNPSPLCYAARDAGLRLHPYTFRRDDLPAYAGTLEELLEIFVRDVGVEALFCDHPDIAVRVRDKKQKVQ
jgi:glycerophosphoryl diester phosphodiesterase